MGLAGEAEDKLNPEKRYLLPWFFPSPKPPHIQNLGEA